VAMVIQLNVTGNSDIKLWEGNFVITKDQLEITVSRSINFIGVSWMLFMT
jgi:hypothetical protein